MIRRTTASGPVSHFFAGERSRRCKFFYNLTILLPVPSSRWTSTLKICMFLHERSHFHMKTPCFTALSVDAVFRSE